MTEQQIEQTGDLKWAERVLSGEGLSIDTAESANAVLSVLLAHGASEDIRQSADALLNFTPPLRLVSK